MKSVPTMYEEICHGLFSFQKSMKPESGMNLNISDRDTVLEKSRFANGRERENLETELTLNLTIHPRDTAVFRHASVIHVNKKKVLPHPSGQTISTLGVSSGRCPEADKSFYTESFRNRNATAGNSTSRDANSFFIHPGGPSECKFHHHLQTVVSHPVQPVGGKPAGIIGFAVSVLG